MVSDYRIDPSVSPLALPAARIGDMRERSSIMKALEQKTQEADKAKAKLDELSLAMRFLVREREKGARGVPAEIITVQRQSMYYRSAYRQSTVQKLRELDRLCPLNRMIEALWSVQDARFCAYQKDHTKLGYRIGHRLHYEDDKRSAKLEKDPDFIRRRAKIRALLESPSSDARFGATFSDLLTMIRTNYRIWDLVPIAFGWNDTMEDSNRRSRDGVNDKDRENIQHIIVLDGGTIEPVVESMHTLVLKEYGNESIRHWNDEQLIENGKHLLAGEFTKFVQKIGPEAIDAAGWVQRDERGNLCRIFRNQDLIVSIRNPTTDPDLRGWGFSPLQQAYWILQSWLEALHNSLAKMKPGPNHINQLIAVIGSTAPQQLTEFLVRNIAEQVASYGTDRPFIPLAHGEDIKVFQLDPGGKLHQQISEQATQFVSMFCGVHNVDPRDLHLPSAARVEEKGGLSSGDASYEQMLARDEGLAARVGYEFEIVNRVSNFVVGPDILVEPTGIKLLDSEATRIQNQKNMGFLSTGEDRSAFGAEEIPKQHRVFNIGGREVDPIKYWPKDKDATMLQLLGMEQQSKQEEQALEQQAAQAAYGAAGMPMGGEEEQPMEGEEGQPPGEEPGGMPPGQPEGGGMPEEGAEMAKGVQREYTRPWVRLTVRRARQ